MSQRRTILIAGAGDVGGRLASLRAARGDAVLAVRRRAVDASPGVDALRADLVSGDGFASLPRSVDALVFCAAPDRRDEHAYRGLFVDGLGRLLERVDAPLLLLVTSSAVYAEACGGWVDEATPADPQAFNGRLLLQAENIAHAHPEGVALRLTGLYGPGRTALLRRARSGVPGRAHWTNRIHVDDAAAALSHLLDLRRPDPVYCGSDDVPALERDVLEWMRERAGLPRVATEDGVVSGRRVSNARLRASGWRPRYPDYRSGYAPLLAAGVEL